MSYTSNAIAIHMGAEHADIKQKEMWVEVNENALDDLRKAVRSFFPLYTEAHMRREQTVRVEAGRDPYGFEEEDDDDGEEDEDDEPYRGRK